MKTNLITLLFASVAVGALFWLFKGEESKSESMTSASITNSYKSGMPQIADNQNWRSYTQEMEDARNEGKLRFDYELSFASVNYGNRMDEEVYLVGEIINDTSQAIQFVNYTCNGDINNLLFNKGSVEFEEPIMCKEAKPTLITIAPNSTYEFKTLWIKDEKYRDYDALSVAYKFEAIPNNQEIYEGYLPSEINTLVLEGKRI